MNSPTVPFRIALAMTTLLGLAAAPAQAQDLIALAGVQIDLWPEFDRPATLVIVDARLEPGVPLPAELTLRLPAAAGGPHAVAARNANGDLLNTPYTTTAAGDLTLVTLTTDFPEFRIEYYDPALTIAGSERNYDYSWILDYPVRESAIRVQQPFDAVELDFEPAFNPAAIGEYGLSYYTAALGPRAAGQALTVRLSYSKPSDTLSVDAVGADLAPASTTPTTVPAPARSPWWIAGLAAGLALVSGGVFWYVRGRLGRGSEAPARSAGRKHRRARRADMPERAPQDAPTDGPAPFCHQCGARLQTGDQFCRNCGTKVRT